MPIDRVTARKNLLNLIQYQLAHSAMYGELVLAVWYGIEDQAEDLFLFEVYERFVSEDGREVSTYRFPGMGYLWLPGLYHVTACSLASFERAVKELDEDVVYFRQALKEGRAEILVPFAGQEHPVVNLLLGE